MFFQLFSIIALVLGAVGVGALWARMGRPFDTDFITALISNVGAPCLVFHTLANIDMETRALAAMAGATLALVAVSLGLWWAVLRMLGLSMRTYLPAVVFPNTGNMGLPLSYLAFGDAGLAFGVAVFTVYSLTHFTLGAAISAGTASLKELARVPLVWGVAAALPFLAAGTRPPDWLGNATEMLAGMTIPLMLVTLGVSLARLRVARVTRSVALALGRMVLGFALGLALAEAFALEGAARGVFILDAAMPVAVFNYLFAERYGNAPEEVAGMVVISTSAAFATLPALLWFVL